ncbi:MAG: hypothetical protein LBE92_10205 [Chryseobacterium sp.]|jgi:hypothetical protein|uniref:hypothetical protein n=1 Tax=Chryseobacterium sp. TaxID=1871047 RepID=UPI0028171C29|nr:hypothetical protein [Chryseobacterium sp.]MDR2236487.1 hypothetical protein [Chryseobacterium sp.]
MLSSADLNLERALVFVVLMLFFGTGLLYTVIVFLIHSIQKKKKNILYYVLSFVISGITGLLLATFIFVNS